MDTSTPSPISYLLLLSGFQHLFCAAHELLLIFELLFQNSHSHLQLAHRALLLMDLCVQSTVLPPERQNLLLGTLALLHAHTHTHPNGSS